MEEAACAVWWMCDISAQRGAPSRWYIGSTYSGGKLPGDSKADSSDTGAEFHPADLDFYGYQCDSDY